MTRIGYTLMCEQAAPQQLVADAVRAEAAGFDFEVISDHYFPWLDSQGHAPNAWVTLGAVAQATERVDLLTYVTCPSMPKLDSTIGPFPDRRTRPGSGPGASSSCPIVSPSAWPSRQSVSSDG